VNVLAGIRSVHDLMKTRGEGLKVFARLKPEVVVLSGFEKMGNTLRKLSNEFPGIRS
jgi:hypothetical protein